MAYEQYPVYEQSGQDLKWSLSPPVLSGEFTRAREGEFDFRDSIKAIIGGVVEGFTTIKLFEEPDNKYERIIKNVSHLVGFAPGILAGPLTKIGALTKVGAIQGLGQALQGAKGIPLAIGHHAARKARKLSRSAIQGATAGRADAFATTSKFLSEGKGFGYQMRHMLPEIAEGAMSLGLASSISSWQGGVDAMWEGLKGGAMAGAFFKGIGNVIKMPNDPSSEKWLRRLSGAMFMGLPAQQRGATTPEIIYEYLAGAYFGGSEVPWTQAKAGRFVQRMQKKAQKNEVLKQTMDPKIYDAQKFEALEPEVKTQVYKMTEKMTGGTAEEHHFAMWDLAERTGFLNKIPKEKDVAQAVAKNYGNFRNKAKNEKIKQLQGEDYEATMGKVRYILTGGESATEKIFENNAEMQGRNIIRMQGRGSKTQDSPERRIFRVPLSETEYTESNSKVNKAAADIGMQDNISKSSEYQLNIHRRDWGKVKNSNIVVGVGQLDRSSSKLQDKRARSGAVAIQMGINEKKPTYILSDNPVKSRQGKGDYAWYEYNPELRFFQKMKKPPSLESNIAVFGKYSFKELSKKEMQRIKEAFEASGKKEPVNEDGLGVSEKEDILEAEQLSEDLNVNRHGSRLDRKMEGILHRFIGTELRKTDPEKYEDPIVLNNKIAEDAKVMSKLLEPYLEKGRIENIESEKWANEVEQALDIVINPEMRGKMRQYLKVQNQGEPVQFINSDGSVKGTAFADPHRPYTLGGKSRLLIEPRRIYHDLYLQAGGKDDGKATYAVLDNINIQGKDVLLHQIKPQLTMSEYLKIKRLPRNQQPKEGAWELAEFQAHQKYNEYIRNVISKMAKQDMYPMEGVGDSGKIIFQKYHPKQKQVDISSITSHKDYKKLGQDSQAEKMMRSNIAYALDYNGLKYTKENVDLLLTTKFIKNAFDHNKRSQIINTPMWRADRKFVNDRLDLTKNNGNFGYVIQRDPKEPLNFLNAKHNETIQSVDGGIHVLPEVVETLNFDAGHVQVKGNTPIISGFNKSFIISKPTKADLINNPKLGALLGKYGIHVMPPKMAEAVRKHNKTANKPVHMIFQESAAKQLGGRKRGKYEHKLDSKTNKIEFKDMEVYELRPEDMMHSQSVFDHNTMLGFDHSGKYRGVKVAKQFFTNLHTDAYKKIPQDVINDIYYELVQKKYNGNHKINQKVAEYLSTKNKSLENEIMRDFSEIGIKEIEMVLKTPGAEKLAQKFFQRIIKINEENIDSLVASGEMTNREANEAVGALTDFTSAVNNIYKNAFAVAKKHDANIYSVFFDKATRKYTNQSLRNFIVDAIATPRIHNSAMTRMRINTQEFDKMFPELNDDALAQKRYKLNSDEIFYLGELHRDMPIFTTIPKFSKTTLGELWDNRHIISRNSPKLKQKLDDVFSAIVLRVPMDSLSGAQVLHFKGFTNTKDYGILKHGRNLEKLGGADNDADEAFVYFGGKSEDGKGFGMKNSWKDMIKSQTNEFIGEVGKPLPKIPVKFTSNIPSASIPDTFTAARTNYKNKEILIDRKLLREKFNQKAWMKPRMKGVKPLPEDAFKTYEQWEEFVINHERAHFTKENQAIPKGAARENHANEMALKMKKDFLPGKTYEDKILIPKDDPMSVLTSEPAFKFAPETRLHAGERAAQNRDQLGPSITMTSSYRSAWSTIFNNKGFEVAEIGTEMYGYNNDYRVIMRAKPSNSYQKELQRDITAFSADPYHRGTIGRKGIKDLLFDAYFEKEYQVFNDKRGIWQTVNSEKLRKDQKSKMFTAQRSWDKEGRVQQIEDINNALYGRNWGEGRKWELSEIRQKLNQGEWTEDERNTFMPMIAETLKNYNADVSVFHRVNPEGMADLYQLYNLKARNPKYKPLKDTMFRTHFKTPHTDFVQFIVENKLWHSNPKGEKVELDAYIKENDLKVIEKNYKDFFPKFMQKEIILDPKNNFEHQKLLDRFDGDIVLATKELYRKEWSKGIETANEFVSQDVDDMATFDRILSIGVEKMDKKLVSSISEHTDLIKVANYLNYKRRNKGIEFEDVSDVEFLNAIDKFGNILLSQKQKKFSSALLDQNSLDREIARFKHKLPDKQARDLYDTLLIGSLRTNKAAKALPDLLKQAATSKDPIIKRAVTQLYKDGGKTSSTQIGYNSFSVSSENIQKFLVAKNKYFRKMEKAPTKEQVKDKKDLEVFNKESDKFSTQMADRTINEYVDVVTGYEGLKPGKLKPEQRKVVAELANWLKQEPDFVGKDLNQVIAGIHYHITGRPKDLNKMNIEDLKTINRWFSHVKSGNWLQKLQKALKGRMKRGITGFDYMEFPEGVSRKMMAHDIKFLEQKGFFVEKPGEFTGLERKMLVPTQYGEILTNYIGRFQESADGLAKVLTKEFDNDFRYLTSMEATGEAVGDKIWRLAIRTHEARGQKNKGEGIYQANLEQSRINNGWDYLKDKTFSIVQEDGTRKPMKGRELVNMTIEKWDKFADKMHEKITGKLDANGNNIALEKYRIGWHNKKKKQPLLDAEQFIKDLETMYRKGETAFMHDIGIDGLRHMTRSVMYHILPTVKYIHKRTNRSISIEAYNKLDLSKKKFYKADKGKRGRQLENLIINKTGKQPGYYPHMFFNIKAIKAAQKREVEKLNNNTELTSKEKKEQMKKILIKYKTLTGDWDFADYDMWKQQDRFLYEAAIEELGIRGKQREEKVDLDQANKRFGNMLGRDVHMEGWDVGSQAVDSYLHKVSNTFYRQLSNMMSRVVIDQMNKNNYKRMVKDKNDTEGKKLVQNWSNFWTLYAREAVGNPVTIPDQLYKDPSMKINVNPYGWWADNRIAKTVNRGLEMLGLGNKDLPEGMKIADAHAIKRWSNTEGKYQLATLMTHPKTAINNVFGGTMHTWMSVGTDIMLKIRNYDYLQTINPKLKTRQDVLDFVGELGITPEMTKYQWGMESSVRGNTKAQNFMSDLVQRMREGKSITDVGIRETARKHGVTDKVMNLASKFMSVPEQMLRADAFMAHYIKAYERFGGSITNPRHPILVEMAKKGVKLTQFLYNAPYRPAFARTGLGKIMSRFMLWSWNSVRFRNEVYSKAKIYGFKPGTDAFERLKRTMQADMVTYALSGAFMYSIFNNVLPAPWSWFQDTAEWALGDEKERDRAFFGGWPTPVAPLQIITPPIARIPMSFIREMADDDYTRLSEYYMYTMFPFGRMARDISPIRDNSLLTNPSRFPEAVFGLPVRDMGRKRKEIRESEYEPPRLGK